MKMARNLILFLVQLSLLAVLTLGRKLGRSSKLSHRDKLMIINYHNDIRRSEFSSDMKAMVSLMQHFINNTKQLMLNVFFLDKKNKKNSTNMVTYFKINYRFLQVCILHLNLTFISKLYKKKLLFKLYDKRDAFDFPIVNFPYLTGDILDAAV